MLRSSAVNLAIGYVLFGIVALVAFAAPLWYVWRGTIEAGRAEILQEDAQRLSLVFAREGVAGMTAFINERVGLQIAGERILLFTDPDEHPLAGNLERWPAALPKQAGVYTVPVELEGQQSRAVMVESDLPGGYGLVVGRDVSRYAPLESRFWFGLASAVLLMSLFGAITAFLIRRELLARIQGIRQTVSAIMQGELRHRLQTRSSGDELDTLSQTINRMLDQIEQLVHGISNISNSIAHDLRTPLAELRARLEELLVTRPSSQEVFIEIEGAVGDVDRVIQIFNALLRLAEIDAGTRRSGFVEVDIREIAAEAVEFYLPAAELRDVSISFKAHEPIIIAGDPLLLAQAVGNLIENALKYTPVGGRIEVEALRRAETLVAIVVSDNGPGIPDADKAKAADRFFRGDASRGTPGVGLGLSIVDAVAKLHGGALVLGDCHPGLEACLTIDAGNLESLRVLSSAYLAEQNSS